MEVFFLLKCLLFIVPVGVWIYFAVNAERSVLGKFAYLALLGGSILLPLSALDYLDERALSDRGLTAVVFPTTTFQESKSWLGSTYMATVSFKTAQGEIVSQRRGVSPEVMALFRAGQPVSVSYLPNDPTTLRLQAMRSQSVSTLLYGVVCLAIGFALMTARRLMVRLKTH